MVFTLHGRSGRILKGLAAESDRTVADSRNARRIDGFHTAANSVHLMTRIPQVDVPLNATAEEKAEILKCSGNDEGTISRDQNLNKIFLRTIRCR